MLKDDSIVLKQYKFMVLGLLSPVIAMISILSVFILDYNYLFIFTFTLYSFFLLVELLNKLYSSITIVLWTIYTTYFILNIYNIDFLNYYMGLCIYIALCVLFFVSILLKKYPTFSYDYEKSGFYHKYMSYVWFFVYFFAFLCSYFLIPNIAYIVLPLILIAIGCFVSIYNILFGVYPFVFFKQKVNLVDVNKDLIIDICNNKNLQHQYLINDFMSSQFSLGSLYYLNNLKKDGFNIVYMYLNKDNNVEIVATLVLNFSNNITLNSKEYYDFTNINKLISFAQIDDLIISPKFRLNSKIIFHLFVKALEFAMLKNIKILITFSIKSSVNMFTKIGFEKLSNITIKQSNVYALTGSNREEGEFVFLYPMVYNLSQSIIKASTENQDIKEYAEILNKHILEYYIKRNYFSTLFVRYKNKVFNLTLQKIYTLIDNTKVLVIKND